MQVSVLYPIKKSHTCCITEYFSIAKKSYVIYLLVCQQKHARQWDIANTHFVVLCPFLSWRALLV